MGKTVYEIGDTWNPDLGEPFGIMFCIQCSCQRVRKLKFFFFAYFFLQNFIGTWILDEMNSCTIPEFIKKEWCKV